MTKKTAESKEVRFIRDHHKEMSVQQLAESTNMTGSNVRYWLIRFGILEETPMMIRRPRPKPVERSGFFNVNARSNWVL